MQAISALIAYHDEGDIVQVAEAMSREMANVAYAEVTYAVRDSSINGLNIKSGDIIGIINARSACRDQRWQRWLWNYCQGCRPRTVN